MFETRERIWIREKNELEERQKKDLEHWQKVLAEMRTNHEMELNRLRTQHQQQIPNNRNNIPSSAGPSKADVDKMEQQIVIFFYFTKNKMGIKMCAKQWLTAFYGGIRFPLPFLFHSLGKPLFGFGVPAVAIGFAWHILPFAADGTFAGEHRSAGRKRNIRTQPTARR